MLVEEVRNKKGVVVSESTVLRALHRFGFNSLHRPPTRHPMHESARIVAYRAHYLERLAKLRSTGHPLVCLDESYVYVNMRAKQYWVFKGDIISVPPEGERVNIVAAIVYPGSRLVGKRTPSPDGHWLDGSFVRWKASRAVAPRAPVDDGAVAASGSVLSVDSESDNFGGNMDSAQFLRWFTVVCATAQRYYKSCTMKLDNARYHKTPTEERPTSSWSKDKLVAYVKNHGGVVDPSALKPTILEKAKALVTDDRHLKCFAIAKKYGHDVIFTPPYHCELQEIDKVWGSMKSTLRKQPAAKAADLIAAIDAAAAAVSEETFRGAIAKVAEWEQVYRTNADSGAGVVDEESDFEDDEEVVSDDE